MHVGIASMRQASAWALSVLFALSIPTVAAAGPIGMIATLTQVIEIYVFVVFVAVLVALFACRWIRSPRGRLLARLLIVVIVFTPVLFDDGRGGFAIMPAFIGLSSTLLGGNPRAAVSGPLAHPYLFAYGATLSVVISWLMMWTWMTGAPPAVARATNSPPAPPPPDR